jgi:hypothetical protein
MDSLRNAGGDRSALRPIMQATNDKVKAVLTPSKLLLFKKKWTRGVPVCKTAAVAITVKVIII